MEGEIKLFNKYLIKFSGKKIDNKVDQKCNC